MIHTMNFVLRRIPACRSCWLLRTITIKRKKLQMFGFDSLSVTWAPKFYLIYFKHINFILISQLLIMYFADKIVIKSLILLYNKKLRVICITAKFCKRINIICFLYTNFCKKKACFKLINQSHISVGGARALFPA